MEQYNPSADPFYDAKIAASELIASILRAPARLLDKGTSSRVLITIATGLGGYITATQAGLTGWEAAAAAAAVAIPGSTYTIAKSLQHIKAAAAGGDPDTVGKIGTTAPQVPPQENTKAPEQPEAKQYAVPFDVTQVRLNADPFLSWEQFEDYFYSLDLRVYNPEIAFEFAVQVLDEGFRRAGLAWKDLFKKAGVTADVRLPVAADFQTSKTSGNMLDQLTGAAEQEFNSLIPSDCSRLAYNVHNINQLVIAFSSMYSIQNVFIMLAGKTIDWNKVATIMDIRRVGLGAV